MTTPACPKCGAPIVGDDINVARDVAYCRKCGVAYALSELVGDGTDDDVLDLDRPPKGAWFRKDMFGVSMGALYRSWGKFFGVLFASIFWNGIVSVFLVTLIGSTFRYQETPLPVWFPMPGCADDSLGGLLFSWMLLTPFILIGMGLPIMALVVLFGKIELTMRAGIGKIAIKVFGIGWTRRFEPEQVVEAGITGTPWEREGKPDDIIFLRQKNGKKIKFGSVLNGEQQVFLAYALRQVCKVRQTSERRHR